MFCLLTKIISL